MKILVSGSQGLVGSSLVPKLKEHSVLATDVVYDVTQEQEWPKVDLIINLAALNSAKESIDNPRKYFATNVLGQFNMLEAARKMGAKYLYLTSIKEHEPHPYGASKACASIWAHTYAKTYDMPVILNQVGNLYGPKGDNFWVNIFMQKAKNNETVEVWGDGTASRDMLYIEDLTDLLVDQVNNFDLYSKHDIIPVGGGKENTLSVNQLLEWLGDVNVTYKEALKTLDQERVTDNKRVTSINGWKPTTLLDEGLQLTYDSIV